MFRALIRPAFQGAALLARNQTKINSNEVIRKFSQLTIKPANLQLTLLCRNHQPTILANPAVLKTQTRTLTKASLRKGKRKSVGPVLKRFMRLDWGIWIRTRAGKNKRMWKKSQKQRYKSRQHVFVNATQSSLLDKMAGKYWKKPKYYVDDIYRPYHSRENFWMTRKKPIEWD